MATRQDGTERDSRGDIDSIIESYGKHGAQATPEEIEVDKKKMRAPNKYRDFEKETARKCFKKPSDWEDTKKISDFLKNSARPGQK